MINLGTFDTTGDGPREYGESGDDAINSDTSDDEGKFKKLIYSIIMNII